jgi:spore coat polysaccharide biosynthesis predicted glycosyltransferase SpsG
MVRIIVYGLNYLFLEHLFYILQNRIQNRVYRSKANNMLVALVTAYASCLSLKFIYSAEFFMIMEVIFTPQGS